MPDLSQKSQDALDLPARGLFLGLLVSLGLWGLIVVLMFAIVS